jgi:hypothetical protein
MARKILAVLGSAVFLVIAPGFIAVLAPRWISRWRLGLPLSGTPVDRIVGGLLMALGTAGLLDSFVRFALEGMGTSFPPGIWLLPACIATFEIRCISRL